MDRKDYDEKIALLKQFCKTSVNGIGIHGFVKNHPPQKMFGEVSSDLIDLSEYYKELVEFERGHCGHILCGDTRESMAIVCLAMRLLKPEVVYEIGRFRGWSTTQMAFALKQNGNETKFVSIDPHCGADGGPGWSSLLAPSREGYHESSSLQKQCGLNFEWELSRNNIAKAGVADFVDTVKAYSHEYIEQVDDAIEFVFIDGDHTYEGAKADVEQYGSKMVSGGLCILHDVWSENYTGTNYGPSRVYAEADSELWEKVGHMWCVGILRRR
jgi:predicted O-methyltransferase YrrM